MDTRQLAKIDLNLLVALQVLLEERNVSKAAGRLFITQSAMSKTLGRLRELFGDQLLTRTSHGMVPTPRATELQRGLIETLQGVQSLVSPVEFEPYHYQGEFSVAIAEYIGVAVLPLLVELLQREAPHIHIQTISRIEHQLEQLAAGNLDFSLHMAHSSYGADFNVTPLGGLPPVLLARQGHPLRHQKEITWDDIISYPHVSLYTPDIEELEFIRQSNDEIIEQGRKFERVFETSYLFTAFEVLRLTDSLMLGPPFLVHYSEFGDRVIALSLPKSSHVEVNYMLVTHRRTDHSKPHQWLRGKILHIVRQFQNAPEQESPDPYSAYQQRHIAHLLPSKQ